MPESELFYEIKSLETERSNPQSADIDILPLSEILKIINEEDSKVPTAVRNELENIEEAVESIVKSFKSGGRLFYFGAGTSGRLGIVDASECPPTFGTAPEMVQGIIAGGPEAVFRAQEGAEDKTETGKEQIEKLQINKNDIVCGIAASGRTPFVKGVLSEAMAQGIRTILITTVPKEKALKLGMKADIMICPDVGPEVITGSTRMKSGTAQKLVLNMLTSASMIKLGKTYGNIMVDLQLTNKKLKERAKRILMELGGASYDEAEELLKQSNGNVKLSLLMLLSGEGPEKAALALEKSEGIIKNALKSIKN